eukprot:TRINITY_DN4641_c0_g1_i1.p1 TRINITY_DN4641_c0_g1~~TRINITY_DN4641_c0_g1_i1.p1  ORF type:complete len:76 (+),score=0.30 TRINITY_DN4641_c0_g1_i1:102-329(+)
MRSKGDFYCFDFSRRLEFSDVSDATSLGSLAPASTALLSETSAAGASVDAAASALSSSASPVSFVVLSLFLLFAS